MKKFQNVLNSHLSKFLEILHYQSQNNCGCAIKLQAEIKQIKQNSYSCSAKIELYNSNQKIKTTIIQLDTTNNSQLIEETLNSHQNYSTDFENYNIVLNKNKKTEKNLKQNNLQINKKKNKTLPKDIYICPEHREKIKSILESNLDIDYLKIFEYRYNEDYNKRLDIATICNKTKISYPGVYRKLYKIAQIYEETKNNLNQMSLF